MHLEPPRPRAAVAGRTGAPPGFGTRRMSAPDASPAERVYLRLVGEYQTAILNYIFRLVGDRDVAEDLTQDTFIKAWRALDRLELDGDAEPRRRAWLYRIAHNTATDHLRRRGRLRWLSLDAWRGQGRAEAALTAPPGAAPRPTEDTPPDLPSVDDPATAPVDRGALQAALGRLSHDQRHVLLLFNHAGLSADEVADVLGIQPAAARKRQQRARAAFEAAWQAVTHGEAPA